MIVCKKCGFNNADSDTFCGSCGTFLEWTGQKVAQPGAPPGSPAPPPGAPAEARAPEKQGSFFDRMQKKVLYWDTPEKEAIERPAIIPGTPGAPRPGMPGMGGPPRPGMPGAPGMGQPGMPPGAPGMQPRPPGAPGMPPGAQGMPPRPQGAPGMAPGAPGMPPGAQGMPPRPQGAPGMAPGAPGMPPGAQGMPPGAGVPRPPGSPGMQPGAAGMPAGAGVPRPGPPPGGLPAAGPGATPVPRPAAPPAAAPLGPQTMQIMPGGGVAPPAPMPAPAAPPPAAVAAPPPVPAPPPAAPPQNAAGIAYPVGPVEAAPAPAPRSQLPMETQVFLPGGGAPAPAPPVGAAAPAPLAWHRPDGGVIPATPGVPAPAAPYAPAPAAPAGPAAPPPPAVRPAAPPPAAVRPAAPPPPFAPGAPAAPAPGPGAPQGMAPGMPAPPRPMGAPGQPPPGAVPGQPPPGGFAGQPMPGGVPGQPPGGQPAAVRPGEARPRPTGPPRPAPPTRSLQQGDLICADCGEGNESTRKFCRRCGHSLAEAEVVSISWWRRMFGRGHPDDDAEAEAGAPKEKVGIRQRFAGAYSFMSTTGLLIVLGVIVILSFIPGIRNPVVDKFSQLYRWGKGIVAPSYTPVHADDAKASTAIPTHQGALIKDGFSDTFWETDTKAQNDPTPKITFTFSDGADIDQILLTSGSHDNFAAVGRPKTMHLEFDDKNGHQITAQDVGLIDDGAAQQLSFSGVQHVFALQMTITATNPTTLTTVAISEVEFFTKS